MRNYLIIAGKDSRDFGVYISGQGTFSAPAKAYTFYNVPGRNGAILGNENRLENIDVSYECFIYNDFNNNIAEFRTFLLSLNGYVKLSDSYHQDEYRMTTYIGPFEPAVTTKNDAGSFTLTFNCKPQRYLLSGDTSYYWVPGGAQEITGNSLTVYSPLIDTSVLRWRYVKHGYRTTGTPTPFIPINIYYRSNAEVWINGERVYSRGIGGTVGVTEAEYDFITGTVTRYAVANTLPKANWSTILNYARIFKNSTNFSAYSDILCCTHYHKIEAATLADGLDALDATANGYFFYSGSLYIKDNRYNLSDWLQWVEDYQRYHQVIVLDCLRAAPSTQTYTAYTPDYPDGFFTLSDAPGYEDAEYTMQYNASDGMSNPTMFPSAPLIRAYGNGSFEIDGVTITITNSTSYTDIDCELMDCYEGSTNRNNDVTFSTYDFPKLQPGDNAITINSGITALEITPRWWRV